ncbi:MAG: UDP-glucose 6-dehydrogenase [Methylibium sp. NZG]|nr:MAG: UDP-glucose 6-dehydrogenase [Methylibium sp. NZG]
MKVAILGTGYVGLVTGACLADLGMHVTCVDIDKAKVALLKQGVVPIYEPGLESIVKPAVAADRLRFTTDIGEGLLGADVVFIAVGTPSDEDGSADLTYVLAAARSIGEAMNAFTVIVDKSTVPVGTAGKVNAEIAAALLRRGVTHEFAVVSNPEFLKEGSAVADFMRPDRIVLGIPPGPAGVRAREIMDRLYAPLQRNHLRTIHMDVPSAELTKYAANAMLATRISFMNELANLAGAVGADIESVRQGIGSDSRIGYHFLYAGTGYGGSCFPKDIRAICHTGLEHGMELKVIQAVEQVNRVQKEVLVRLINRRFGPDLRGRLFGLWGLAFKPNTDDMRDAPSRVIIEKLVSAGARVIAYDPVAMKEARRALATDLGEGTEMLARVSFAETPEDCVVGADALVIATEWKIFKSPDWSRLRVRLKQPVVFDGRNLFSPRLMRDEGFEYHSIGRGTPPAW